MHKSITRLTVGAALGIGSLAGISAIGALPAGAGAGVVNTTVHCSGTSLANLQLQREDTGQLSVDFGVDMARHKAGVSWSVHETRNGTVFVSKSVRTIRDGSFSISSLLAPLAGTNTVSATAVNATSGEICTVTGSV